MVSFWLSLSFLPYLLYMICYNQYFLPLPYRNRCHKNMKKYSYITCVPCRYFYSLVHTVYVFWCMYYKNFWKINIHIIVRLNFIVIAHATGNKQ